MNEHKETLEHERKLLHEYSPKVRAALQDGGLVPRGEELTLLMVKDYPDSKNLTVFVAFQVPKPPISPTAKALREVQA
jgi:hypothetical protein